MLRISGVGVSHTGLVRTGNEDSGFVGPTCMLVADGVGGAAAGEVASATTAYVVAAFALAKADDDPVATLVSAVAMAQEQVAAGVLRDPSRAGMATTLTALVTDGQRFALAHIGDSRGYVVHDGELRQVTADHTYVQRMIDGGSLTRADVPTHPWRNVVLRSVNGHVEDVADVVPLDLVPGDRVLLASDGLTDLVDDGRIAEILEAQPDDAAVEALVDEALARGGIDNVTCLLATIVDGPDVVADGMLVGAVRDPANIVDASAVRMPDTA